MVHSDSMYVCICKAISQSELKDVIKSGAENLEAVESMCGAGSDCGACKDRLLSFLSRSAEIDNFESQAHE